MRRTSCQPPRRAVAIWCSSSRAGSARRPVSSRHFPARWDGWRTSRATASSTSTRSATICSIGCSTRMPAASRNPAFPCLNAQAQPVPAASNGACAVAPNPNFHVPSGASGVAQLPGNKAMISVGLWDTTNHVGSRGARRVDDPARARAQRRAVARRPRAGLESGDTAPRIRAELQAGVSQRDELPVPGAGLARRRRRRPLRLLP